MTRGEIFATVFWIAYGAVCLCWCICAIWMAGFRTGQKRGPLPIYHTPLEVNGHRVCTIISNGPATLDLEGTESQLVTRDGPAAHVSLIDLLK